ncbi:ABC transporter G family member 10-like [Rutidosis leptorrhynchoides]|uniref:ABC transporter G family member 10-like n=1 Tax=Rutidosis leptorrhynchoides TaxID=125765 RepID=UPI003A9A3ED0
MELLPVKAPESVSGCRRGIYRLEAKNLSYKLRSRFCEWLCWDTQTSSKFILENVNCEARLGELTAIAGPSGAGKTTLLEILAGSLHDNKNNISGQVLVNNKPMDAKRFGRISGYVTQDDALFPLLTVEETLTYSARLRLPKEEGRQKAASRVRNLIKELGLEHVANSRIGSDYGISGGEKRRVSIGVDLVHDPGVVLIDEPTSGLDSASALHIVTLLKSMAVNQAKTIVFTIHQPGFRILEKIDRLVLLSYGSVVHNGSLDLLQERIHLAGHRIPRHVNVLEFAIDVADSLTVQNELEDQRQMILYQSDNYIQQEKPLRYANSAWREVLILGKRFCSNIFRTNQLFATRVIQALVAGFVLGTVFLNVGKDQGRVSLQTRIGFFAFSLTFLLSSTTEGLPIFLQERRILTRETSRGAYRVSSYVVSNTLVFLPFLLLVSLLYSTPVYWLVGLRRSVDGFLYFSLIVWMVVLMSNSFVACFSALVPNFIMGNSVIAGLMGSFFLFSGYFISEKNIPSYWIFMHYLSLFKYPYECFMINEYGGEQGKGRCVQFDKGGACSLYADAFLKQQGLRDSQKWSNLAVIMLFIIAYRLLCFFILWYRCHKTRI